MINVYHFSLQLLAFTDITCAFRIINQERGMRGTVVYPEKQARGLVVGICGHDILCAATRGQFNTCWHLREKWFVYF